MSDFLEYENESEILEEQDSGVWLSIGDLMSGLLMFFALLFITVQVQLHTQILRAKQLENELARYKKAVDELPVRILDALEGKVGNSGTFQVDPETGDVSIGDRILFDEGSAELKPEGERFLQQFIPTYSEVIFSDNLFDRQIIRIIIEGHTSSKGADKDNMELSLRRSLAVSDYILSDRLNFPSKANFRQKILASGRGEIDSEQKFDNPSDRKVVFRFQFRREDFQDWLKPQNTTEKSTQN